MCIGYRGLVRAGIRDVTVLRRCSKTESLQFAEFVKIDYCSQKSKPRVQH